MPSGPDLWPGSPKVPRIFRSWSNSTIRGRNFDEQGDALPATDACRGDAVAQNRAAPLARHGDGKTNAGGGQRMADGDGAAVDVEPVAIEFELAFDANDLCAEGFVD